MRCVNQNKMDNTETYDIQKHMPWRYMAMANISRTKLLRIYNSLVGSIIEYGFPVWQITPTENMKKLEAIQRKGLSICLGLLWGYQPTTSGREVMKVESNILEGVDRGYSTLSHLPSTFLSHPTPKSPTSHPVVSIFSYRFNCTY